MLFVVRCSERGKEPHAAKNKLRNDIADRLRKAVPNAEITFDTGRIYVEADRDIAGEIAAIHGVSSFSPAVACDIDDLDRCFLETVAPCVRNKSFRVKVRRTGKHAFSSNAKAAALGAALLDREPTARVDLTAPECVFTVEIRDRSCVVCTSVTAGIDYAAAEKEGDSTTERGADGEPRFLVDAMLGTLASRLRAFGYDTAWRRDTADSLLLREAHEERRMVLTQDRELAEIGGASAMFIRGKTAEEQLREVMDRFHLSPNEENLFTRCSLCNAVLVPLEKSAVKERIPQRVFETYNEYWTCRPCDKVYWKGSHHGELLAALRSLQKG